MSEKLYHYVYLLTCLNPIDSRIYYMGVRSCDCDPEDDPYMGSSTAIERLKDDGIILSFKKIIIKRDFLTRKEAEIWEQKYHAGIKVSSNGKYFNIVEANSFAAGANEWTEWRRVKHIMLMNAPDIKEKQRAAWRDVDRREKRIASMKVTANRPENRKKRSDLSKSIHSLPGQKEKRSQIMKSVFSRPGYKEKHGAAIRHANTNPETKERHRKAAKRRSTEAMNDPEQRSKLIERLLHPDMVAKRRVSHTTPEARLNHSKAARRVSGMKRTYARIIGIRGFYNHIPIDEVEPLLRILGVHPDYK